MVALRAVSSEQLAHQCAYPDCDQQVVKTKPGGRPKLYCSERCKQQNATHRRALRRQLENNRAALSQQGSTVGLTPLIESGPVTEAATELQSVSAQLSEVAATLSELQLVQKVEPLRRSSASNETPESLFRIAALGIGRLEKLLVRKYHPDAQYSKDQVANDLAEVLNAAVELAQLHGVTVPPSNTLPRRFNPAEPEGWYEN